MIVRDHVPRQWIAYDPLAILQELSHMELAPRCLPSPKSLTSAAGPTSCTAVQPGEGDCVAVEGARV